MKDEGLKAVTINPLVEAPIIQEKNYRIIGFSFDKSKWTPETAKYWAKGKIMAKNYDVSEDDNKIVVNVIKTNDGAKLKVYPVSFKEGISAIVEVLNENEKEVDYDVNPIKKINQEVINFIQNHKDKTPKEINALLGEKFRDGVGKPLKLHPATIYKIKTNQYAGLKKVDEEVDKEVTMKYEGYNLNPLITEILENKAVPLAKLKSFQKLATGMAREGKTAYDISIVVNKALEEVAKRSPQIMQVHPKIKVGSKGYAGQGNLGKGKHKVRMYVSPKYIFKSMIGKKVYKDGKPIFQKGFAHDVVDEAKLIDVRMLRGHAKKLFEEHKDWNVVKEKLKKKFEERMEKLPATEKARVGRPWTAPKTKALLEELKLSPESPLELTKKRFIKRKRKEESGLPRKRKRRKAVSIYVGSEPDDIKIEDYIDAIDLATADEEEFEQVAELTNALNPLIAKPNIVGLLEKMGPQALGVLAGGKLLELTDWLGEKVTFLIPIPWLRNLVTELLSCGSAYYLSEALLPYKYERLKQSAQTLALAKFLSNFSLFGIPLVKKDIFAKRPILGAKQVSGVSEEDIIPLESNVEEDIGEIEVNDEIFANSDEIVVTDDQIREILGVDSLDQLLEDQAQTGSLLEDQAYANLPLNQEEVSQDNLYNETSVSVQDEVSSEPTISSEEALNETE